MQLGGGIRDLATIEMWLGKGVRRVILGTAAVKRPARWCARPARRFPGRIVVGIDATGGKVAVEGWAETSELDAIELARRFEDAGVAAIIYTDIDRDGVLQGLNLPATAELARATSIPVIASGGLAGIDDVEALLRPEYAMLEGAIAGRALYDGRLDAREALTLLIPGRALARWLAARAFTLMRRKPEDRLGRHGPTDPDAFLLWASQRRREEGKFELSRGRVSVQR